MENNLLNEELIELEGFITFYKFENEANGYRIASFKIDDNKQERTITIVGYFPHFNKSDALTLKGKMIHHKRFGLQVEVSEIYKKLPTSKENIIRFLSSSQFKGIGKKIAENIYNEYKEETITTLINSPTSLTNLLDKKIITEKHADAITNGLKKFDFTSNAYQLLLQYGFSLKNIMKAEATYGEDLDKIIQTNPYQLVIDIDGIGFKTVDKLAKNMGIADDDKRRVKAAILYCVSNYCHATGNTYLVIDEIYNSLIKLIKIDIDLFEDYIKELINENLIVLENEKYYHISFYNAEKNIANNLSKFINRNINTSKLNNRFDDMIEAIQYEEGITYSLEQRQAIYDACANGLHIITGGPGTGKTTILKAILKMLKMLYGEKASISLCAPTGRASKRMSYLASHYACTIHRLLKWDLHSNTFVYNANNKLSCDVIIIDEFSMVDTLLFEALLNGTTGVSQIIIIGDDGQLPSVGAGNLLHDLLKIDKISNSCLSYIYRQTNGSSIVDLAYNIRNSSLDESFKFNGESDVSFLKIKNKQSTGGIIKILEKLFNQG